MSRKVSARSLFFHIAALALALIVPSLVFSVVLAKRWVASEEARLGTTAREQNDRALVQIERYLAGQIAMLQALASSPALESRDFKRFDQQARELLQLQGADIVLRDRTGRQWINTRLPWGAALPRTDLETDQVVLRTRQPSVSDLFASAASGAPVAVAIVPVLRQGEVEYLLSGAIPPQVVADLLRKTGVAEPYSAFVTDRTGRMIARFPHPDHEAGEPFRELAGPAGAEQGSPGTSRDEAVASASQISDLSGWRIGIGVRTAAL